MFPLSIFKSLPNMFHILLCKVNGHEKKTCVLGPEDPDLPRNSLRGPIMTAPSTGSHPSVRCSGGERKLNSLQSQNQGCHHVGKLSCHHLWLSDNSWDRDSQDTRCPISSSSTLKRPSLNSLICSSASQQSYKILSFSVSFPCFIFKFSSWQLSPHEIIHSIYFTF